MHSEIGELVLQCIFNALPVILDECLLPSRLICESHKTNIEGILTFKQREYYFQLKNQSLYYSSHKEDIDNPKGIILIKDLFVERFNELGFVLRNTKFRYELFASSPEQQDFWVKAIQTENSYKDFNDHYQLLDYIGKGAHGEVRLVSNKNSGEISAVKIISKAPLDTLSETRIRRELGILKICKHEGILELKDTFETADRLYIVTEYLPAGTLFSWLKIRNFRLEESVAKSIIKDIASALKYLHSHGIIHRDLKLENILIQNQKDSCGGIRAKIIDFGLSCILGPGQNTHESVGTLKYASPEVLSRNAYRESADIWSLGVISFILLAGRMPFYGRNDQETAVQILKKKVECNGDRWNHTSPEAKMVVEGLLSKRQQGRMNIDQLLTSEWIEETDLDISLDVAE